MNRRTRAEILESLREKERNRALILGTGAGTGLSAVAEEKGGADLIIAYATGRYRMAGRSSMTGRFAFSIARAACFTCLLLPLYVGLYDWSLTSAG